MSRRKAPLLVALIIAVAAIAALPAAANHPNTGCDSGSGNFSNNEKRYLQYYNINWSGWNAHGDYHAIRENIAGNETYHQYNVGFQQDQTTTPDGLDSYLRTVSQRGGYSSVYWFMVEHSHFYC
jgi:hypothetical protein